MRNFAQLLGAPLLVSLVLAHGCAMVLDDTPKKSPPVGLIATPPSYYSTLKAKYLGQKYQDNLSRLIEKIVRNPKTANLQFANNIASVGGIGFFTHSAAKVQDERYLEVVLVAPETFEKKGDYSTKLNRLFLLYGSELLAILSSDADIFREPEVAGYGLNLSWRTITSEASGPSVTLERAVAYFPKPEVQRFLKKEVAENSFLRGAVIFAAEADGPMSLVSYRPQERKPDFRPPIQEEVLAAGSMAQEGGKPSVPAPQPQAQPEVASRMGSSIVVGSDTPVGGKVPPVMQASEEGAKSRSDKIEKSGLMAPAQAVQSPISAQEAAQQERAIDRPIVQKSATSVAETSQHTEAVSGLPPQAVEMPMHKTAAASPQTSLTKNEPEVTKPRDERPPKAKTESTSPGPETTKQTEAARKPSEALSQTAGIPKPAGEARVAESRQSPVVAAEKSKAEASSSGTRPAVAVETSGPEAKKPSEALSQRAPGPEPADDARVQERVAVPVALAKPGLKTTAEAPQPSAVTPPKAVPAVSPSVKDSHQPKAAEQQAPGLESAAKEVARASTEGRGQARVEKIPVPRSSLVPDRAASVASKQEVETRKTPESVEARVSPPSSAASVPEKPSAETQVAMKKATETPAPVVKAKEPVVNRDAPSPSAPVDPRPKPALAKPVQEELALLTRRPSNKPVEDQSRSRAAPKSLKGYIIQIAFADKQMAQQWAERLERRGYVVSVTQAGGSGSLRVRIGNFPVRQEAERELQALGKDGLRGIVLNLPDGFRPREDVSKSDAPVKAIPTAQ